MKKEFTSNQKGKTILFFVEFDNGDSNCYRGDRVPTIEEARILCKKHIEANKEWDDVAYVGEVSEEQAKGLWDLSYLDKEEWPEFSSNQDETHNDKSP